MFKLKPRKCEKCPLSWAFKGAEDYDCGCYISHDFEITKWCYLPKFLCEIKRKKIEKAELEYYESHKKYESEIFEATEKAFSQDCYITIGDDI